MAVITLDILIEGMRRDDVFTWLSDFEHHFAFMQAGFPKASKENDTHFSLPFQAGYKTRSLGYHFERAEETHGGRRVLVKTTGKRLTGHLHLSLRTMKPSSNTLITLHMDYDPGSVLGAVLQSDIQQVLERNFRLCLESIKTSLENN